MKLYNDDCLKILKDIESESIDCVVTDCPYHIVGGGCTNAEEKGWIPIKDDKGYNDGLKAGYEKAKAELLEKITESIEKGFE